MKMRQLFLAFAVAISFTACLSGPEAEKQGEVKITRTELAGEKEKTIARLVVGGMTCAHGCGGKIQQELQALKGVVNTDLDYADGRTTNVVAVEYDPKVINENELIKTVQQIADGQYPVSEVEIVTWKLAPTQTSSTANHSSQGASVLQDTFAGAQKLMSVWQLVSGLIR